MQQTLQTMLRHRALLNQTLPVGNERSQFAHFHWRYPDLWNELGRQELGQGQGIPLVRFDKGGGNDLDLGGISHDNPADQGNEQIVEIPGIDARF